MKKYMCAVLSMLVVLSLSACGGTVSEAKTQSVDSKLYSQQEITSAIEVIKKEFKSEMKGCTLTEIYYAGDDFSKDHQEWADRHTADETLVLLSSFHVGSSGGQGCLNPNSTYRDYMWILVRTNGGQWQHVDGGY